MEREGGGDGGKRERERAVWSEGWRWSEGGVGGIRHPKITNIPVAERGGEESRESSL